MLKYFPDTSGQKYEKSVTLIFSMTGPAEVIIIFSKKFSAKCPVHDQVQFIFIFAGR